MPTPTVRGRLLFRYKGESGQKEESILSMAARLNKALSKRGYSWPRHQGSGLANIAELYRYQAEGSEAEAWPLGGRDTG